MVYFLSKAAVQLSEDAGYLFAFSAFPILFTGRIRIAVIQRQLVPEVLSLLLTKSMKYVCVYLLILKTSEKDVLIADLMKWKNNLVSFLGGVIVSEED